MPGGDRRFAETRWTLVLEAATTSDRSAEALAQLCEQYWKPLHAYVRARGYSVEDAQDLTQAFFTRFIEHHDVRAADPARGRFRTFLLTALQHFLANEHDRATAVKRGGGVRPLSLDADGEDAIPEPADTRTPERIFEEQWARVVLDRAVARTRTELDDPLRLHLLERLAITLSGVRELGTAGDLARAAGVSEGAVRTALHRLRKRLRSALESEVADTVTSAEDAEEEMRHLFAVLLADVSGP